MPTEGMGLQVLYADGDSESIFLPMERMRLTVRAGETLDAPTPDELTATAQHLLSAADATDNEAKSGEASPMLSWACESCIWLRCWILSCAYRLSTEIR